MWGKPTIITQWNTARKDASKQISSISSRLFGYDKRLYKHLLSSGIIIYFSQKVDLIEDLFQIFNIIADLARGNSNSSDAS